MSAGIRIFDTHQHLIYPEKHRYSWTAGIPQLAGKAFRYDDYCKAIEGTRITETVFMESGADDPHWQEETRFVHALASTPGSLIRASLAVAAPSKSQDSKRTLSLCCRPGSSA